MRRDENHSLFQNREMENSNIRLTSLGLQFHTIESKEPVLIAGTHLLIPTPLLKDEELFQKIFSIETFQKLTKEEKSFLKVIQKFRLKNQRNSFHKIFL
jgi:hypothetical protein